MFSNQYGPISVIYSFIPIFDMFQYDLNILNKNINRMIGEITCNRYKKNTKIFTKKELICRSILYYFINSKMFGNDKILEDICYLQDTILECLDKKWNRNLCKMAIRCKYICTPSFILDLTYSAIRNNGAKTFDRLCDTYILYEIMNHELYVDLYRDIIIYGSNDIHDLYTSNDFSDHGGYFTKAEYEEMLKLNNNSTIIVCM